MGACAKGFARGLKRAIYSSSNGQQIPKRIIDPLTGNRSLKELQIPKRATHGLGCGNVRVVECVVGVPGPNGGTTGLLPPTHDEGKHRVSMGPTRGQHKASIGSAQGRHRASIRPA